MACSGFLLLCGRDMGISFPISDVLRGVSFDFVFVVSHDFLFVRLVGGCS